MLSEKINFKQFIEYKAKLKKLVPDEEWQNSLMFDSLINESFYEHIIKTFSALEKTSDATEVEKILELNRKKCIGILEEFRNEKDIARRWHKARLAYAFYGLNEAIIEGSSFSEKVVNLLEKKYGEEYISIIQRVDRASPSILTNFYSGSKNILIDEAEIRMYLLLKRWQDDQNIFHNRTLYPIFENARDEFSKIYFSDIDCGAREKLVLNLLSMCEIVNIETVAQFVNCGMENELASVIGGKAYGLAVLKNFGVNVPQAFFVPVDKTPNKKDLEWLDKKFTYAVRSSADCEDGKKHSFAGMFSSYLDTPTNEVYDRIIDVKRSQKNSRLQAYVEKFKLKEPNVAVVIQQFIEPDVSGVFIGKSKSNGVIEFVEGTGEKLVSGKVVPASANCEFHKPNLINGIDVSKYFLELQNKIGMICDFEWCIKGKELFMLQFRPVTTIINTNKQSINGSLTGTPASRGIVSGKVCFLEEVNEAEKFKKGDILLTYYTDPDWVEIMVNASGIITSQGGFLCHTAIIARELNIPCITGIGDNNLEFLAKQKEICIDGGSGTINVKKKSKSNKDECIFQK